MFKSLLVAFVFAGIGVGLGLFQSAMTNNASEERFTYYRPTMAERQKQENAEKWLEAAEASGNPQLEIVGDTEYDFGSMMHGDKMSHDFVFRNTGDGPLRLEMGDSSCKCTVGQFDKSVLEPGEETNVTLTWEALSVTHDFGQYAKIKTNDVNNIEVKLNIFGQITEVVTSVPRAIKLDNISDTEATQRTIMVYAYSESITDLQQISWTNVDTDSLVDLEYRKVPLSEVTDPAHKNAVSAFEIKFTINPGVPIGNLGSRIQYRTNRGEEIGTMEIPITGRAVGSIELAGGPSFDRGRSLVKLGTVKKSEGKEVAIVLFVQGDDRNDVKLEVASVSPEENLEVEIGDPEDGPKRTRFPIRFRVPKNSPEVYLPARGPGTYGAVTIKTSGAMNREVKILVQMKVER
ncbi:MAG: DUF1573 domain-containing protein [Planctomycetota bacterium]